MLFFNVPKNVDKQAARERNVLADTKFVVFLLTFFCDETLKFIDALMEDLMVELG